MISRGMLIIADEDSIIDIQCDHRQYHGSEVRAAGDPRTGLQPTRTSLQTLIILDLMIVPQSERAPNASRGR